MTSDLPPRRRRKKKKSGTGKKQHRRRLEIPQRGNTELLKAIGLLVVGLIGIGLGAFIYYQMSKDFGQGEASNNWAAVDGTITESRVDAGEQMVKGVRVARFSAVVRYKFDVAGRSYEGGRISFNPSMHTTHESANAVIGKYPQGSTQTVYYDPQNPGSSVLTRGVSTVSYAMYLIPLGFGGVGLFIALIAVLMIIIHFRTR